MPKQFALVYETGTAVMLLRCGLGHLQKCMHSTAPYHVPLVLLSLGFERLMKIVLCLHTKLSTGAWPAHAQLSGRWGHKLVVMRDEIIAVLESEDYGENLPNAKLASELQDAEARRLLQLLADFAHPEGRYFHLNIVGTPQREGYWVEKKWLTATLDLRAPNNADIQPNGLYRIRGAEKVVAVLEKLARALCQALVGIALYLGPAGDCRGLVVPFHGLQDPQLGQTDYRACRRVAWATDSSTRSP